ncbi:rhodanese-like domain-containing protein [Erysipelothrix anatis]|uniref:rhodanese-like domain-containing protein n=1 Tax=Erysipelothrix anatis TaxID=2683713 RepID=UPI001356932A|nr:rhodanese-like domain-containing protein [Erysipelothrix anatis]
MFQTILINEFKYNQQEHHVIDVREPIEFAMGSIPNALNIPLQTIPYNLGLLDKSQTYHIVCQSGSRSYTAAQFLAQQGYKVVNMLGGMSAYRG